jgi:hypothetical protein
MPTQCNARHQSDPHHEPPSMGNVANQRTADQRRRSTLPAALGFSRIVVLLYAAAVPQRSP